jgi:hypothetical protein
MSTGTPVFLSLKANAGVGPQLRHDRFHPNHTIRDYNLATGNAVILATILYVSVVPTSQLHGYVKVLHSIRYQKSLNGEVDKT